MSAGVIYFLFVLIAGQGNAASFNTLASYPDKQACTTAAGAVNAALKDGVDAARVFCASSEDVKRLATDSRQ